jgi:hypothetical protein
MRELQQNSLLENANLIFEDCSDDLVAFLAFFMPLLAGINSIKFNKYSLYMSTYSKYEKYMLKATRILETS